MRVKGAKRNPNLVDNKVTVNIPLNSQKPRIHNVFIIDASGSMTGSKYSNAIDGVNELLKDIKTDTDTDNTVTVVEFEGSSIKRILDILNTIPDTYGGMGTGGSTPLNQAIGETLEYIHLARKTKYSESDKVLINIFTDGEENSSRGTYGGYNGQKILGDMIKQYEKEGFTITFMGTKSEVKYAVDILNLKESNTLTHMNTASSIKMSYDNTKKARMMYSKSVSRGEEVTQDFYTKTVEEKK
jgi:Mg-chelatase subunit ChlD